METRVRLSPREFAVLVELAKGKSSKETAAHLRCSKGTIEQHVLRLRARFNAQTRAQLVYCALRAGVLPASDLEDLGGGGALNVDLAA